MTGKILIENHSEQVAQINIEGVIGLPESEQFETPAQRIATYETFTRQIEAIRSIDAAEIVVNIRSAGGSLSDALLIHDALVEMEKPITTRCYGYVASAATVIAQAASAGKREMSANGLYLIHRCCSSEQGNAQELAQTAQLLQKSDQTLAELYAARSARPVEGFMELIGENAGSGRWLSAQEALEAGLIDRVIPAVQIANSSQRLIEDLALPPLPEGLDTPTAQRLLQGVWGAIRSWFSPLSENQEVSPETTNVAPSSKTTPAPADDSVPSAVSKASTSSSAPERGSSPSTSALTPLRSALTEQAKELRAGVRPSTTEAQDDPTPIEGVHSHNDRAYGEDARSFRL